MVTIAGSTGDTWHREQLPYRIDADFLSLRSSSIVGDHVTQAVTSAANTESDQPLESLHQIPMAWSLSIWSHYEAGTPWPSVSLQYGLQGGLRSREPKKQRASPSAEVLTS